MEGITTTKLEYKTVLISQKIELIYAKFLSDIKQNQSHSLVMKSIIKPWFT